MKKEELKKELIQAFKREESVVGIYMNHLAAFTTKCKVPENIFKEVKDIMEIMIKVSEHHKNTCQNLLSRLEEDPRDVF